MIRLTSELPLFKAYTLGLITAILGMRLTKKDWSRLIKIWTGFISIQGSCRVLSESIKRAPFPWRRSEHLTEGTAPRCLARMSISNDPGAFLIKEDHERQNAKEA